MFIRKVIDNRNADGRAGFYSSIRTKMLFYFSLLFSITLLSIEIVRIFGIPFTDFTGEYRMEREKVFQGLNLVADLKKDRFLRWLKEVTDDSRAFAENSIISENVLKLLDLARFSAAGDRAVWTKIRTSDAGRAIDEYITLIRSIYGIYSPIQVVDFQSGKIIASTDENDIGKDIRYLEYISDILNHDEFGILTTRHFNYNKNDFNLFRVIKNGDRAIAALVVHIDIDDIIRPMLHTGDGLGRSGEALLVDSSVRNITSLKHPLPDGRRPGPLEYEIRATPAVLAASGEEGIILSEDYRGVPVLAAYRYLLLAPDLGWGLVVKRDVEDIYAQFRARLVHSAAITVLGILFVSAFVLVITRKITGPIMALSNTARSIEQGNLKSRAPVTTSDEVGDLAATFNSMVKRLEDWYTELETQVESRTAQLRQVNEELAVEINERKHSERVREQLIQELESKNAELERFTYTVSHDLKSPLITIHGFMGVMEKAMHDGNIEQCLQDMEYIKKAAMRMQKLLDDLLDLSRVGCLANPSEDVAVDVLAEEALSLIQGVVDERKVKVKIAPDLPSVFVDRGRIVEVFQNLIENAVKFMDNQESPEIEIGAGRQGDEALCYIKDNGIGIDPKYHEKIFSLFDKLNPQIEGTGVGLSLVKRIIEVHGGRIWVNSGGAGEGAVFYFTLPLKRETRENGL